MEVAVEEIDPLGPDQLSVPVNPTAVNFTESFAHNRGALFVKNEGDISIPFS